MKENFLHYLWRMKRFDISDLRTTQGETITIQKFGTHNHNAGPDFLNAKIQIGDTLWAGNVEMHLDASEWMAHKHQDDAAYNNVILHVVMDEDRPILRASGERIPCLEIKKRVPLKLVNIYQKLLQNEHWIPCQHHFFNVKELTKNLWLDRLLVERLEQKTEIIEQTLDENNGNWEETFYQFLAKNFGVKVNAEPFAAVANSLPLLTLAKHKNNAFQLEALLFGQSGLLEKEFTDDYPNRLKKEYSFLQKKHSLIPIEGVNWRFLRMRPANFPTIRIAQFAMLIHQSVHLFSKILDVETVKQIEQLFKVELSDYWLTHYVFDKESKSRSKRLGKNAIQLLIINTIVPFLFLYGKRKADSMFKDRALTLLEEILPEKNSTIEQWKVLGMQPESAYQTQALLQLKNEYCSAQRCLECGIGGAILK
ncbi:MAG: hypothetical protein ACI9XO_004923 [Paraglaciecola sp.]|jgi:hypothetical protein